MIIIFTTEQELIDNFLEYLINRNPWDTSSYGTEFNYMRGKTDVVAISPLNEVIAIEAKLKKWRGALQQAYRNRCFANKSYVLLPLETAQIAYRHEHEFDRRGVGICCIQDNHITIIKEAIICEPIQPWLKQRAFQHAMEG